MTRDDIIRLAREAHMHHMAWDDDYIEGTERFAALVAAAEREECALLCEKIEWSAEGQFFAKAIRARGQ